MWKLKAATCLHTVKQQKPYQKSYVKCVHARAVALKKCRLLRHVPPIRADLCHAWFPRAAARNAPENGVLEGQKGEL